MRTNPIADDDLAAVCVDALTATTTPPAIDAGGPDVVPRRAFIELAAAALSRQPRARRVPPWLAKVGATALRPLHPRIAQFAQFAQFVAAISTTELIAPVRGNTTLADAFARAVTDRRRDHAARSRSEAIDPVDALQRAHDPARSTSARTRSTRSAATTGRSRRVH